MGVGVAGDPSGRLVLPPLSVTLDLSRTLSRQSFKDSRGRVTRRSVGVPSLSLHPSRERGKLRGPGRGSPDGHSQGHCRDGTAGPETARTIEVPPPVKRPGGRDRAPDGPGRRPRPEASGAPGLALPRFRGACACTCVGGGQLAHTPFALVSAIFPRVLGKSGGREGRPDAGGPCDNAGCSTPCTERPRPRPAPRLVREPGRVHLSCLPGVRGGRQRPAGPACSDIQTGVVFEDR